MSCSQHFLVSVYAVVANVLSPAVHDSRVGCATSCFRNTSCSTFFFNEETSSCYLQNRWIQELDAPESSTLYYFILHTARCNSGGYQFVRTVSLCLRVSRDEQTWSNALAACKNENARLVKIDTAEKQLAIEEILIPGYKKVRMYVGGSDQTGKWIWTDESPVQYTHWAPNEPNNRRGNEHCMEYIPDDPPYGWNDANCDDKRRYMCEKLIS